MSINFRPGQLVLVSGGESNWRDAQGRIIAVDHNIITVDFGVEVETFWFADLTPVAE